MSHLDRFTHAQDQAVDGYRTALDEIRAGGKRSHWIWYIFPQLAGLGSSPTARTYGIADAAEARAYLRHPVLRARLLEMTRAVAAQLRMRQPASVRALMGSSIDAQKLVSSMTLFGDVAGRLHAAAAEEDRDILDDHRALAEVAAEILAAAEADGYPPCERTRQELASTGGV